MSNNALKPIGFITYLVGMGNKFITIIMDIY